MADNERLHHPKRLPEEPESGDRTQKIPIHPVAPHPSQDELPATEPLQQIPIERAIASGTETSSTEPERDPDTIVFEAVTKIPETAPKQSIEDPITSAPDAQDTPIAMLSVILDEDLQGHLEGQPRRRGLKFWQKAPQESYHRRVILDGWTIKEMKEYHRRLHDGTIPPVPMERPHMHTEGEPHRRGDRTSRMELSSKPPAARSYGRGRRRR